MQIAPRLALAAAIVALGGATGGAVIGAQIGESEIIRHASVGGERPQHDFQADYDRTSFTRSADRPPDQYAIKTPEGTFGVGELRERGLYRNRRHSTFASDLAAQDRAWEQDMAALESDDWQRDDWQPDPRFADRAWREARGRGYDRREYGVTVARIAHDTIPPNTVSHDRLSSTKSMENDGPAPATIGPQQVKPLDLPVPVTLPPPSN